MNSYVCPNCGDTTLNVVIRPSLNGRLHIMAFCAAGPACKILPVISARTRAGEEVFA